MKLGLFSLFAVIGVFLFGIGLGVKAQTSIGSNPNFDLEGSGAEVIFVAPPDVVPPEIFTLPGAQTNFTQVCTFEEAVALILDVPEKNKIEFGVPTIDMCDDEITENLDRYIQLDNEGEVTVRSDLLPSLKDKSAIITMRNLSFAEEPDIEIDGRLATNDDIGDKDWDSASRTLRFTAKHFTTYKAVQRSPVSSTPGRETPALSLNGFLIFMISAFFFVVIIVTDHSIRKRARS